MVGWGVGIMATSTASLVSLATVCTDRVMADQLAKYNLSGARARGSGASLI